MRWKDCDKRFRTAKLLFDVVKVCRAGVTDGDGGRCHPCTAVHIQEVS